MRLLLITLSLTMIGTLPAAGATTVGAAGPEVIIGMPFDGRWAYNVVRQPPYSDQNSSHPSVHALHSKGADWSTDLYAKAGTKVKLLLTSSAGKVRVEHRSSGDSCGQGVGGRRVSFKVYVGSTYIGWVSLSHLDAVERTPRADMVIGTVTAERTASGCYETSHVHMEVSNDGSGGHACWVNHGNVGTLLAQGAAIGRLGSANRGQREACSASHAPTPSSRKAEINHAARHVNGEGYRYQVRSRTKTPVGSMVKWQYGEPGEVQAVLSTSSVRLWVKNLTPNRPAPVLYGRTIAYIDVVYLWKIPRALRSTVITLGLPYGRIAARFQLAPPYPRADLTVPPGGTVEVPRLRHPALDIQFTIKERARARWQSLLRRPPDFVLIKGHNSLGEEDGRHDPPICGYDARMEEIFAVFDHRGRWLSRPSEGSLACKAARTE